MFEGRKYVMIPAGEVDKIDFNEVLETSADTCRYSVDGSMTFVKYDGDMPESVASVSGKSMERDHASFLEVLAGPEWTPPFEEGVESA